MKFNWRSALVGAGYAGFGLVAFVLSFWWHFPADTVADRVVAELRKATSGKVSLHYDHARPWGPTGLSLEAAKLNFGAKDVSEDQSQTVSFDRVSGRLALLPLVVGRTVFDLGAQVGQGRMTGSVAPRPNRRLRLDVDVDKVALESFPVLSAKLGAPIRGQLSAATDLDFEVVPERSAGTLSLEVSSVVVGPGTVAGFTVPEVSFGTLSVAGRIEKGIFRIESSEHIGSDITLAVEGQVTLRQPLTASNVEGCLFVKPTDKFLAANETFRTALEIAQVTLRKDQDGRLEVPLKGSLAKMSFGRGPCIITPANRGASPRPSQLPGALPGPGPGPRPSARPLRAPN